MFPYERIKQKMDELSISNADIARATNKSTAAVSKWVNGQNVPKGESLLIIANVLQTTTSWLLSGDENARRLDDGATIEMLDPRPVVAWDAFMRYAMMECIFLKSCMHFLEGV